MTRWSKTAIKIGFSSLLAVYVFVFSGVDIRAVIGHISSAAPVWVLAASSLHITGLMLSAMRWKVLLKAQGIHQNIFRLFSYYLVGHFFNMFLPSAVGGDIVRIYDTSRDHGSAAEPFAVILVERISGLLTLLLMAGVVLILDLDIGLDLETRVPGLDVAIGVFIAFIFMLPILFHPLVERIVLSVIRGLPVIRKAESIAIKLFRAFRVYKGHPGHLFLAVSIGVLLQINYVIHYYLVGRSLGIHSGLAFFFVLIPVRSVALMIPFFINGIGLREFFDATAFNLVGVDRSTAVAFAELAWLIQIGFALFGGIMYVARRRRSLGDSAPGNVER